MRVKKSEYIGAGIATDIITIIESGLDTEGEDVDDSEYHEYHEYHECCEC